MSRRGHTDPGPGNSGKQTPRLLWGDYERGGAILKLKTFIQRVVIITSEVNIPNTYWPWPGFSQFSGKLQDTIAVSAGRVKRPAAHRNQGEWENYFRQPGPGYLLWDSKHKPDPGLGFHFQFLNSFESSDRLSQDGRLILLHSQFYLGLNLEIFLETDYGGGFSGINLNSSYEMLCPRVKSCQSDGRGDYSKPASHLPGKHPSRLHLPSLNSMNVFWDVRTSEPFLGFHEGVTWGHAEKCHLRRSVKTCVGIKWMSVLRTLTGAQTLGMGTSGSICGIDSIPPHTESPHVSPMRQPLDTRTQVWRQFNDKKVNLFCHLSLFPLLLVNLLWLECDSSYP